MIVSTSPIGIGNESAVAPEKFSHSFSMETPVYNFQKFSKEMKESIFLFSYYVLENLVDFYINFINLSTT